jgi:hypothetical protein
VVSVAIECLQRLDSIRGSVDREPILLQVPRQHLEDHRLVIHYEHARFVHGTILNPGYCEILTGV